MQEVIPLPGYHEGNWNAGGWFLMAAMMMLFWALVVGLVVLAVRSSRGGRGSAHTDGTRPATAEDVLTDRYARGEIDEVELRRRRELLHGSSGPRA